MSLCSPTCRPASLKGGSRLASCWCCSLSLSSSRPALDPATEADRRVHTRLRHCDFRHQLDHRSLALRAVFSPALGRAPRPCEWLSADGAHRNSLDAHISRRIGANRRFGRRPPEYGLALCPVARGLRPVRDHLYPAEGCRSDRVAVAMVRSCGDHSECSDQSLLSSVVRPFWSQPAMR